MISVVVCTFNRAPVLRKMLDSFFRQKKLDEIRHEIVIVDNNSSDDTAVVVRGFLKNKNASYFHEASQGLSFARNRGVAEARGEFISFLDDDVLVNENWLSGLKACFDETDADVVGGKVSLKFETPPQEWLGDLFRRCLSEVDLGPSRMVLSNGDDLYGANLSFRRKIFESIGLFDINGGRSGQKLLCGEETQMVRRIVAKRGKVFYDPNVHVEHLIGTERLQWQYFAERAESDGLTLEFLDPKASWGFQVLRVCRAIVEFLKAAYSNVRSIRTKDSYERKLAEFVFCMRRSYLTARFARLIDQSGKHRTK